ncbi:hypothetical protein [Flavobacterium geliluteum]|uniref:Uncharacterized protein n=1 Tax=Flavobacterium geliluteum TaxID=2816120 RepID=A0A941AY75_9FLAO|nr:hypothetical protein [Flavobacterium geliluteum]MBP4137442.1 hypothetical protein [Flavobacterium geliluteum]
MIRYELPEDNDNYKESIADFKRKINHLSLMLETTQDISKLREEHVERLEHQLKDMTREKFIFVN